MKGFLMTLSFPGFIGEFSLSGFPCLIGDLATAALAFPALLSSSTLCTLNFAKATPGFLASLRLLLSDPEADSRRRRRTHATSTDSEKAAPDDKEAESHGVPSGRRYK